MDEQITAIIKEVERFNDSIIETLDSKKISDTKEAARSLHVTYGNDFVRSVGIFYIEFLDVGRRPGKMPPLAPIEDWVERKLGIDYNDSDFDGIVYTIRRKIADMGTSIYLNNSKGLELNKKILTLRKALREEVTKSAVLSVRKKLRLFKNKNYKI